VRIISHNLAMALKGWIMYTIALENRLSKAGFSVRDPLSTPKTS
jgi:hypothetical protein